MGAFRDGRFLLRNLSFVYIYCYWTFRLSVLEESVRLLLHFRQKAHHLYRIFRPYLHVLLLVFVHVQEHINFGHLILAELKTVRNFSLNFTYHLRVLAHKVKPNQRVEHATHEHKLIGGCRLLHYFVLG